MVKQMIVVCGAVAILGIASPSRGEAQDRKWWLDVNFGVAKATDSTYTAANSFRLYSETAAFAVAYGLPTGAEFDFGTGYMLTPIVGIGVSFTGTAHQDIAGLAITIPHPLIFNRAATDADVTNDKLTRAEGGVNIQAMFNIVSLDKFRLRAFVGPTFFRATQDTVSDIRYGQVFNLLGANVVNITTYTTDESEGTGWGAHVGADASYFFSRVVGVGAIVRFSRGSVEIDDLGGTITSDVKVGGVQAGGGLRLRF